MLTPSAAFMLVLTLSVVGGCASSREVAQGPQQLRGTYSYMADAGRFTECGSATSLPVAPVAANAELERAYLGARSEPGAPLLVTLTGHFEDRPSMEGDRQKHVVVDRFERVWPGRSCESPMSNATGEKAVRR